MCIYPFPCGQNCCRPGAKQVDLRRNWLRSNSSPTGWSRNLGFPEIFLVSEKMKDWLELVALVFVWNEASNTKGFEQPFIACFSNVKFRLCKYSTKKSQETMKKDHWPFLEFGATLGLLLIQDKIQILPPVQHRFGQVLHLANEMKGKIKARWHSKVLRGNFCTALDSNP